ncbi:---NA--- : : PemK [Gemmataceae bacterium]|nr:---NA--- : : PemK [Gemmataceae bacterium]VTT96420.1 ---NA--- : : PemK [Gemmataceae bacterium]
MSLSQGRIVWATLLDSRGANPKARPAVIVTPTADIDPAGEVQIAAVTTLVGQAPFAETVELPFVAGTGHPETKLKKPCEVVCSWLVSVPVASVQDSGGFLPAVVLAEVLAKVQRIS